MALAPRVGKINQIPHWLAIWTGKMERYSLLRIPSFVPVITFRQSPCKIFLSQNIFHDGKKIFCDFSVGMQLENKKTEKHHHFCLYIIYI